jgi:ribosomal protein L29
MSSHYRQIKKIKYSAVILDAADAMVAGKGDGRISLEDAENLFSMISKDGKYSDLEKRTLSYVRDNFKFTVRGDTFLRSQIRSWSAIRGNRNKAKVSNTENASGIQALSDEELVHKELQLDRDVVDLRFAKQMGTLKQTHRFKLIRREIAQLRTEQVSRENARGLAKNTLRDTYRSSFVAEITSKVTEEGSFASELNEQMEEEE